MGNRIIKFRGKRADNGEWAYGEVDCGVFSGNSFVDGIIIPETVGQFTGLKDKNGVEIYEGDILEGLGYVVWGDNECRYLIDIIGERNEVFFDELSQNELEVIGNITNNPELMGGEE